MTTQLTRALSVSLHLLAATCEAALGCAALLAVPGCTGQPAFCDDYVTELALTREASVTKATLRAIADDGRGRAIAVGDGGAVQTREAGGTWQARDSEVTTDLLGIAVASNGGRIVAVGAGGVILTSEDGGATWLSVATEVTATLRAVTFLDDTVAVAVGDGVLLRSTDAGETWTTIDVPATAMLRAVAARSQYDSLTGTRWIAQVLAVGTGGVMLSSRDQGASWEVVESGLSEDLLGVGVEWQYELESDIWVVLGAQQILRGPSESELEAEVLGDELLGLSVDGSWQVGVGGAVRRSWWNEEQGARELSAADDPGDVRLLAVAGSSPALAVGENGVIVRVELMSVKNGSSACAPGSVEGRPFIVDAEARTADAVARSDWHVSVEVATLPAATRQRLAAAWTRDGLYEHASIASFARFVLQLLAVGAPPELVVAGQAALADEIVHAQACFGLASAYAGAPVGPGPLAIDGALAGPCDLAALAGATAIEGCVNETIAALIASTAAELTRDPVVRARLSAIAADERRHAALAWRTVAWALAQGDASVRTAVAAAFACEPALADDGDEHGLETHGRLSPHARRAVARAAWRQIIAPQAATLLGARPPEPRSTTWIPATTPMSRPC